MIGSYYKISSITLVVAQWLCANDKVFGADIWVPNLYCYYTEVECD